MTDIERAKAYEERSDFVGALKAYRDAYLADSKSEAALLGIAMSALYMDNIPLSLEFFVKLLILNHDHAWGYWGRAKIFFQYGQEERALEDMKRAIAFDQPATELRIDCAVVYNAHNYPVEALAALEALPPDALSSDGEIEVVYALLLLKRYHDPRLVAFCEDVQNQDDPDPLALYLAAAYAQAHGLSHGSSLRKLALELEPSIEEAYPL